MGKPNWLDRFILDMSPRWGASRLKARIVADVYARHYEAATQSRRTEGWRKSTADANMAAGAALSWLRSHSRDLKRNNSWASNGLATIVDNTVGWGIEAKPVGEGQEAAAAAWKSWAGSTACDADGRLDFAGLQALALGATAEGGEVLIRRRWRRPADEIPLNFQLQILEGDFLDTSKDGLKGIEGGPIIQGVEFDAIGRRVAYWLFEQHPGSGLLSNSVSRRVSARDIIHLYRIDRPGQVRGVPWLATAILNLKDFDEFEDAQLMKQKIAACFAAFVTDFDGQGAGLGEQSTTDANVTYIEPGTMSNMPAGRDVKFVTPPSVTDDGFSVRTLRRIAAGLRVPYESLTGDYSQVNFSSARMARLQHWAAVRSWRWHMLVPHLCEGAWGWAMEAAQFAGLIRERPAAEWTEPPMPMIEPGQEVLASIRSVRGGLRTPDEIVREQGYDPETFWPEYAKNLARLDELGIKLDSDVRAVSQAGLTQERVGIGGGQDGSSDAGAAGGKE